MRIFISFKSLYFRATVVRKKEEKRTKIWSTESVAGNFRSRQLASKNRTRVIHRRRGENDRSLKLCSKSVLNRFNDDYAKAQIVPLFSARSDSKQIALCGTSYWNALRVSERRNWDGNKSDNKGATATRSQPYNIGCRGEAVTASFISDESSINSKSISCWQKLTVVPARASRYELIPSKSRRKLVECSTDEKFIS